MSPRLLVLVEHSEGSLFQIEHELETERHFTDLAPCLVDIRDKTKLRQVFETHRPAIVFHAAAFKHVPMMQANPAEAFDNNCFATLALIEDAVRFGTGRLVSISTDKAVEPETVMGLSKALTERIVETMAREADDTKLMTVRFGNVLGSSGSVVPLFQRQIAAGGPVTVTDERMTRFFMTIPEAVRLVIQAGAMGNGGEIFVLDMGEPMKIVDLAREMIRLSGLDPDRDIEIVFTGNRGAEKLDEKLFSAGEQAVGTTHPKIAMAVRRPVPRAVLRQELSHIREALARHDVETALRLAREVVRLAPPSGTGPTSGTGRGSDAGPAAAAGPAENATPASGEAHPAGNGSDSQASSSPSAPPAPASAAPAPPASPATPASRG
jgi:FlaA1/EpsC-like NDP-sugar epimerase